MEQMQRRHFIASAALAFAVGQTTAPRAWASGRPERLLVVGDSLSAEYGLRRGAGWVALLEQRLKEEKLAVEVVNASISGDTTAGGLARLPALLQQHRPTHVVIGLGGNDALRGLPLSQTESQLARMVRLSRAAGATVLLVGIQVPPNYGRHYTEQFARMFDKVAREEGTDLVPFLLAGVADRDDAAAWFQADRIHPNERAQPLMLDTIWPTLRRQLDSPAPTAVR